MLQFPLEYEKFLEQKFAIQQQSANFPLNKETNQGEDHRPDLAPQESPHLSEIHQEDSPRRRKHHKAAEAQSILNKEYQNALASLVKEHQNVSASLVKELKVIPLIENEPMEENASHAKTMFHGPKDTKSSQPQRHKKVTSKGKHKKIPPKRQKRSVLYLARLIYQFLIWMTRVPSKWPRVLSPQLNQNLNKRKP